MPASLEVQVCRAQGVKAADPGGKSDPYCVVSLAASSEPTFKTDICQATLDPLWKNQNFVFPASSLSPFIHSTGASGDVQMYGYVVIEVWDHDTVNQDDYLGRLVVPLCDIAPGNSGEVWYPLTRKGVKDTVSGSIGVKLGLHLEEDMKLNYSSQNSQLYEICKARGYHLPVISNQMVLELPGNAERVEIALSHVLVDVCSFYCSAQVFLTSYRLIILAKRDRRSQGFGGRGSTVDHSMWIALNNIQNVEMETQSSRIRRNISGQRPDANTRAIHINCFDVRRVKLLFILEDADQQTPHTQSQKLPSLENSELGQKLTRLASLAVGGGEKAESELASPSRSPRTGKKLLRLASDKVQTLKNGLPDRVQNLRIGGRGGKGEGKQSFHRSVNENHLIGEKTDGVPTELNFGRHNGQHSSLHSRARSGAILNVAPRASSFSVVQSRSSPCITQNSGDQSDNSDDDMIHDILFEDPNEDNDEGLTLEAEGPDDIEGHGLVRLTPPKPTAELVQTLHFRLEDIVANVADYPPAQHYVKSLSGPNELNGWDVYNFPREMDRQGVPEDHWKLTAINGPQYDLCPTYPQLLYIPKTVMLSTLQESAKFRSKGRLPCLVWVDQRKRNFMLRCAQPLTGAAGKHSKEDELLIQAALESGPREGHLMIFDARSFSAATGNKIMGKGTEDIARYPSTRLTYLDIPNIHAVRESYESLKSVCLSSTSAKWLSALENTQWISYISLILKGAIMIARYLKLQQGNVLVHCSDGWDRTSQLTALSQLMMDAYYRTMQGFKVLVEKEWLSFGHKFQQRLGHPLTPNERSPIFLQFLDCVHQMMWQYPNAFEFNTSLLLRIAEHLNTAWFGTFLCNCDRERHQLSLYATTLSLWAHIDADQHQLVNRDFKETTKPIFPIVNMRRLRLWEEYFLTFDPTHLAQQGQAEEHNMSPDQSHDLRTHQTEGQVQSWCTDTVVWMSNERTTECCFCQQKFTAFKRKHHCRACGRIFCNDCTKRRIALTHLGYYMPVRVCDECYSKLHGAQNSQDTDDGFVLVSKSSQ